ncbi:MAG: Ig-like domain-containing protein [Sporichthyaceae bacterium]
MKRSMKAAGAITLAAAVLAGPAWSYIVPSSNAAEGYAKAGVLGTPKVKATRILTGHVFFGVEDAPPGYEPQGYVVKTGNGNAVCTIHGDDGGCNTLLFGLYFGKQTFNVRAFAGTNWVSAPATCSFGTFSAIANCGSGSPGFSLDLNLAATLPLLSVKDDLGISSDDGITNIAEVTLLGTAIAKSTVVLFSGGQELGRGTADDEGRYAIAVNLGEGVHELTAVTRWDGDSSPHTSERRITVDLTAPKLTVDVDASGGDLKIVGTAGTAPGDQDRLKVAATDGAKVEDLDPSSSGRFAAEVDGPEGAKVTVSQSDVAGNRASESVTLKGTKDEPAADPKPADEPKASEPKAEEPQAEEPTPTKPSAPADPAPAQP